ncbi:GNAT family N-acetyltransferase [Demequina sp. NBRC 110053]|uniref:GNAT family N-acetyltransferase n=1 Tax=Demequina sp. NBRC 110053 TaxID=1570342 RepID=UPI001F3E02A9|nr:GNAT family N-acetyltransferase [Demequina sp. NBRC 110053]
MRSTPLEDARATPLEVLPATPDRWEDVRTILGPRSMDTPSCWCLSLRVSAGDPRIKDKPPAARAALLRELCGEAIPPGVLGYRDGEVVGWCSVSPRSAYHRLVHSRVIPKVDEEPAWSVVCFVVRAGHRKQGVAGELLEGAVAFARERGAPVIEGYPADTGGARIDVASAYAGSAALFARHGFTKAMDTSSKVGGKPRVIMRRRLD